MNGSDTAWGSSGWGGNPSPSAGTGEIGFDDVPTLAHAEHELGDSPLDVGDCTFIANSGDSFFEEIVPEKIEPSKPTVSLPEQNEDPFVGNMISKNEVQKFLNSFVGISSGVIQIAETARNTIESLEKACSLAQGTNTDLKTIEDHFNKSRESLSAVYSQADALFGTLKIIVKDMSDQKRKIETASENAAVVFQNLQDNHTKSLLDALSVLEKRIDNFSHDLNLDPLAIKILDQIEAKISELGLSNFKHLLDQAQSANALMRKYLNELFGDTNNSKEGIISDFEKTASSMKESVQTVKKGIHRSFLYVGLISGTFLGCAIGFIMSNKIYQDSMAIELGRQTLAIQKQYQDRFDNLNLKLQAYAAFERKYGLNNNKFGFSYFTDTGTLYFFYPKGTQSYLNGDKTIVELP